MKSIASLSPTDIPGGAALHVAVGDLVRTGDSPLHQLNCFTAYAIMAIGALAFASVFVSF